MSSGFNFDFSKVNKSIENGNIYTEFLVSSNEEIISDPIWLKNHLNKGYDFAFQDSNNYLNYYSNKGDLLWRKSLSGRIIGEIKQIDLYKNGRLQILFRTNDRLYLIDRNGKEVSQLSFNIKDGEVNHPISVFDYDKNRNYRILVTTDNDIQMYDNSGKIVNGFNPDNFKSEIINSPVHLRIDDKDYIVLQLKNGELKILNRRGKDRVIVDEKIQFIKTVTKVNKRRIPFICSVTSADVEESIELTKSANSFDADGICVQLPATFKFSQKENFLKKIEKLSPRILMIQDLDWSGDGMALEEIVKLFYSVDKFNWLKIETVGAGKKYSAVLKELDGRLKVCGGWAVTQLIDAMARSVNAFIPTGLEKIYVEIYRLYQNGNKEEAQLLFEKVLPVLNFSNQNIGTSIRFFKNLRVLEGLFESNYCRYEQAVFSELQETEAAQATSIAIGLLARPG